MRKYESVICHHQNEPYIVYFYVKIVIFIIFVLYFIFLVSDIHKLITVTFDISFMTVFFLKEITDTNVFVIY